MSTVKISQLPVITTLSANNANTLFVAVNLDTQTTGQFSTTTMAQVLFANNVLNVGTAVPSNFPGLIAQFVANNSSYGQVNYQNINPAGSMDVVLTTNDGTDANGFIDLGINNSQFNGGTQYSSMNPHDGYLYVHGLTDNAYNGNLIIGTASSGANVLFVVGNTTAQNIIATLTKTGLVMNTATQITFADGSKQSVAAAPANYTQSAFNLANTNQTNIVINQGVDLAQNTAILNNSANTVYLQGALNTANANSVTNAANISYLFGIESSQNTLISSTQANTIYTQGVDVTQNTNIGLAWNKANTSLQNTSVITANTDLVVPNTIIGNTASFSGNVSANYFTSNTFGSLINTAILAGGSYWYFYSNNSTYSTANTYVGPLWAPSANIGPMYISNNSIYSSNTTQDINFGQLAATANINFNRVSNFYKDINANNGITVNDSGLYQYSTSNNTTVTQLTNKSTAVYSNGRTGQITTSSSALNNTLGSAIFYVYNSQVVSAKDVIILNQSSGAASYQTCVSNVAPGQFAVTITNVQGGAGASGDVLVLNYAILRVN